MPVDDFGFLDSTIPVGSDWAAAGPGDLLTPVAAAQAPALIVLGEPGLGKTVALKGIADELAAEGRDILWFDGAQLDAESFDSNLAEGVMGALNRLRATDEGPATTLIVDGLDESPVVRTFPSRLARLFAAKPITGLRIIIGCRTADLPPRLVSVLTDLLDPCLVVDLAPLRRSDAVALADDHDVDGAEVVSLAASMAAGSLAAIPLTLGLVVEFFRERGTQTGVLPAGVLFADGVRRLLAEPRPEVERPSTIEHRISISERMAAVLLLSGRRTIFLGPDLEPSSSDMRASVISDGDEQAPSGPFRVTLQLVRDSLVSPLYSARGSSRRAFAHSSHAAFLGARYLTRLTLPRSQLEDLLLVAGPDGTRTVPIPLRELAAWMASFDHATGKWLAGVDPLSLVGHASYLDSNDLREFVTAALLERADEVELAESAWRISQLRLSHDHLAEQVMAALADVDLQPEAWPAFARCRLALRLAAQCRSSAVARRMVDIAASSGWNAHMRAIAARSAVAADDELAVPELRMILGGLADRRLALSSDPDDELKGSLLRELWPRYLSTGEVLPYLLPQRQGAVLGSYWMFLRDFAAELDRAELRSVLAWARRASAEAAQLAEPASDDIDESELPLGRLDLRLLDSLLDRALAADEVDALLDDAAALTWPRLKRSEGPLLPSPLDEVGEGGDRAARKRRQLAEAVIRYGAEGTFDRGDAWCVISHWRTSSRWFAGSPAGPGQRRSRLLDQADFEWCLARAVELDDGGQHAVARAMSEVAAMLFDHSDPAAVELASFQTDTVNWSILRVWFDAVPLTGEVADRLRKWHQLESSAREDALDEVLPSLRVDLLDLFDRVVNGDWAQFWRLAWNLQFPPGAGHGQVVPHDRLLDFAGVGCLGVDAAEGLCEAARTYLLNEHDYADEWLGTDRYDKRAWAGYLALALLDERGEIDSLAQGWAAAWAGAVLWFHSVPHDTGDPDRKARLLRLVSTAAPARLAEHMRRYVVGELNRGSTASEVTFIDPSLDGRILDEWRALLSEMFAALTDRDGSAQAIKIADDNARGHAGYLWESMVARCAVVEDSDGRSRMFRELLGIQETGPQSVALIASGLVSVLSADPSHWRLIEAVANDRPNLARQVIKQLAASHRDIRLLSILKERELSSLYLLMRQMFPPEGDALIEGGHFLGPEEQARQLRDSVLGMLASRGSEAAVHALASLHDQLPLDAAITSNLLVARGQFFANAWVPPTPEEVLALLIDSRRRLVRSSQELASLVEATLASIAEEMPRSGEFLWDRSIADEDRTSLWRPKPEAALAAFIAHDLELRLVGRGLAVHREVLIKPTDPYGAGDRTDILIEANAAATPYEGHARHRVVIEVKCPWNRQGLTDLQNQLVARYLPEAQAASGLYLMAWYPQDLWTELHDYRREHLLARSAKGLRALLQNQADRVSASGVSVRLVVMEIPRPAPNPRA